MLTHLQGNLMTLRASLLQVLFGSCLWIDVIDLFIPIVTFLCSCHRCLVFPLPDLSIPVNNISANVSTLPSVVSMDSPLYGSIGQLQFRTCWTLDSLVMLVYTWFYMWRGKPLSWYVLWINSQLYISYRRARLTFSFHSHSIFVSHNFMYFVFLNLVFFRS